jgi:uncharacterized protein (TIGR02996 family)
MSERESLLAAVIAAPDDDAVRLVYADWLDEHGDEDARARAEFIRVQIQRGKLGKKSTKRAALEAREKELLAGHAKAWLKPLPKWARPRDDERVADDFEWFGFERGFVKGVILPGVDEFIRDAEALFATEPITHAYLGTGAVLPRLAKSPEFMNLMGLRFGHYALGDAGTIALAKLPPMPRLRQLWMYKSEIGNAGLKALAKWPGLATVEDLELGFNDFQAPGIKALIASPHLTKLKRLDLSDSLIAPKTKQALEERFGEVVEL